MRSLLLILAFTLIAGCSALGDNDRQLIDLGIQTEEEYRDKRAQLVADLDASIGEARASEVSECAVVPVGTKACGGPLSHRVYSTTDGVTERILELANIITELDAEANSEFGIVSDCSVSVPPTPVLEQGRCVAGTLSTSAP